MCLKFFQNTTPEINTKIIINSEKKNYCLDKRWLIETKPGRLKLI
jgi:hypothetical protein